VIERSREHRGFRRFEGSRVYGFTGSRVYGFMGLWVYGFKGLWVEDLVVIVGVEVIERVSKSFTALTKKSRSSEYR
jgi:hypothetical protein